MRHIGQLCRRIANSSFSRDVAGLYLIYGLTSILPLVTTPYLARILGPSNFGLLAFFQTLAMVLTVFMDFGFNYSATRTLARNRGKIDVRIQSIREVFGAKLILALTSITLSTVAMRFVPIFRSNPTFLLLGVAWGCIQGLNLGWYFQGVGQISKQAAIDLIARGGATACIYLFVRSARQAALPLTFNALFSLGAVIAGLLVVRKETPLRLPGISAGARALSLSWPLFLYRAALSIGTLGSGLILGFFNQASTVAYYAGAERLVRGLAMISQPMSQALYAQLNHRMSAGIESARTLFKRGFLVILLLTTTMGSLVFAFAPFIVRSLLGNQFLPSVGVLRTLSLVIPLSSLTLLFGVQWMVPLGLERTFTKITVATSAFNLIAAAAFAPRFAEAGVSFAIVISELLAATICFWTLQNKKLNPFKATENPQYPGSPQNVPRGPVLTQTEIANERQLT